MGTTIVTGYRDGKPFELAVAELEGGHLLAADLVPSAQAMLAYARALGIDVAVSSAWRSMSRQTYLHDGWKAGHADFNPADPPGFSTHQEGRSLDLSFRSGADRERFATEVAAVHGWSRPVGREPWHFLGPALAA
jgi:LAS superfamily LD-carboxypeptidase LdcB